MPSTRSTTDTIVSLASTFTEIASRTVTSTSTYTRFVSSLPTGYVEVVVTVSTVVEAPFTCRNLYDFSKLVGPPHYNALVEDIKSDPDIAGIGVSTSIIPLTSRLMLTRAQILLAFIATACFVVLLALTAYIGGFLPIHFLRRVDRRIFGANSRHEDTRWRTVIEGLMMSLSDQQLVTGLAILVAGYCEMMNSDLTLYYWRIVTHLAWLSSSVHIASLTLLRDVLNKHPTIRNVRVAGMLVLLTLLTVALWPTRFLSSYPDTMSSIPAKCFWTSTYLTPRAFTSSPDPNWILTLVMLWFAYVWKLSQLFASSRDLARQWLVARPEAAIERFMRRAVSTRRSKWFKWPAYKILTLCYISFVAWAEFAESFVASIIYLCMALPYGITAIMKSRSTADDEVIAGERTLTFGQLVPLFLLVLPILLVFELSSGMWPFSQLTIPRIILTRSVQGTDTNVKRPEAIYSLLSSGLHRPRRDTHPDLISALRFNEPSKPDDKLQNDSASSYDPIVDHLMSSRAFKTVVWGFFAVLAGIGLVVVVGNVIARGDFRFAVLTYGGLPAVVACVPLFATFVLPFSRRLR